MVLPEPAAHDARGQAVGWVDEIALSLGLSAAGAIALVDRAHPARLGDLVRTLRHTWPEIDVYADVRALDGLSAGSTLVLAPRAEDADWLNQRRQLFAERRLKVVLWCDEATTVALARGAVDFYDWIAHRQTCPPGPAPFAVRGLRAAFDAKWPVVWTGDEPKETIEDHVRAAGEDRVSWVDGAEPYEQVLQRLADPAVVAVRVGSPRQLRRARWAIAEARRSSRVILVAPGLECPGFWPVRARFEDLARAREALGGAGARAPGRLAALLDLEPEAIEHARGLLSAGVRETDVEAAAAEDMVDPVRGLSRLLEATRRLPAHAPILLCDDPLILRSFSGQKKAKKAFDEWMGENGGEGSLPGFWAAHASSESVAPLLPPRRSSSRDVTRKGRAPGRIHEDPRGFRGPGPRANRDLHPSDFEDHMTQVLERRAYALEPVLRAGGDNVITWVALATAAASLGEHGAASRWLSRVPMYDLPSRLRGLLRRARAERDPLKRLTLCHEAIDIFRDAALNSEHLETSAVVQWGTATAFLVGAGLALWLTPYTWLPIAALAPALAFLARGFQIRYLFNAANWSLYDSSGLSYLVDEQDRASEVLSKLRSVEADLADEQWGNAEESAREALEQAKHKLGEEHPLHAEATRVLGSVLLANQHGREALQVVTPLLSPERPISDDLALLTARILAGAGRAGEAVRALEHLTGAPAPAKGALLPATPAPPPAEEPAFGLELLLLSKIPAGTLAKSPDAHLALAEALLKQGRYPEALLTVRKAVTTFASDTRPSVERLLALLADLERRLGPGSSERDKP